MYSRRVKAAGIFEIIVKDADVTGTVIVKRTGRKVYHIAASPILRARLQRREQTAGSEMGELWELCFVLYPHFTSSRQASWKSWSATAT